MKIPRRIHCTEPLPGDAAWIITERHGQLVVYLARDIPQGSPLEQLYVRQAVRAWRRDHQDRLLGLLPIAAGGAGLGWLINQFRRPAVTAGTAVATVAGVALAAVTLTDPPKHPAPRRPPVAEAPPSQTPTRTPHAAPPRPAKPQPPAEPPAQPQPVVDTGNSVSVDAVGPVRVPPIRTRLPVPIRKPTVAVPTPVPQRPASSCRLVRVEVGKLVRVCL